MKATPHIFTLTGNLLAERTLQIATWTIGGTQRAVSETFQVGGKGINVSKMLNRLKAPNTALFFSGGSNGAECESWLRARAVPFHAFKTTTATRRGIVVRAPAQLETTFLGPDDAPDEGALRACAEFLNRQSDSQVLAICGSLPGWTSPDYAPVRDAIHHWAQRGFLVVDTYGPPLLALANESPALVKINRSELASLFGDAEATASCGELLGKVRKRFSARAWVVTDGPAPVWFGDEDGASKSFIPPTRPEVSATGSGDVMLACILHARFRRGISWDDAVGWSLPFASANAAHAGVAEFPWPDASLLD